MGLDLVEFVIAVENAFEIQIPNEDAAALGTPGLLIDYVVARLPRADTPQCLSRMAFYRIRKAALDEFRISRRTIRPRTAWPILLPAFSPRQSWKRLHTTSGVPRWPRLSPWHPFSGDAATVGSTARFVAAYCPAALKGAGGAWTRQEVVAVVTWLMEYQFGITSFRMDASFVRDLKLD